MKPADRCAGAGVADRLELVVPGLPQRQVELAAHDGGLVGVEEGGANAILGHDDVAVHIGLRMEDPEVGCVGPATAVIARRGLLSDLVAQVRPAPKGARQPRAGADLADPARLGAHHPRSSGLLSPVEVDTGTEDLGSRPLDVRAQRAGRGVHE